MYTAFDGESRFAVNNSQTLYTDQNTHDLEMMKLGLFVQPNFQHSFIGLQGCILYCEPHDLIKKKQIKKLIWRYFDLDIRV